MKQSSEDCRRLLQQVRNMKINIEEKGEKVLKCEGLMLEFNLCM
jgi:5-enolpyruvylshikimate-3-phosphate synthase